MTEDEAREKWCPFFQVSFSTGFVDEEGWQSNRSNAPKCIASDCMAWRSVEYNLDMHTSKNEEVRKIGAELAVSGYCGLAGKL